jgi:hypothetical protein
VKLDPWTAEGTSGMLDISGILVLGQFPLGGLWQRAAELLMFLCKRSFRDFFMIEILKHTQKWKELHGKI